MKYKLAIFDLDGTVLNTIEDLADSLNFALSKAGFPERRLDEVLKFVGNGIRNLICQAVPDGTDSEITDGVFADFRTYYREHCADKANPYNGIAELLGEDISKVLSELTVLELEGYVKSLPGKMFGVV